jgi:hypothetical protein
MSGTCATRKTNLATSPPSLPAMTPTKKPRKARVSRRVAPKKKPAAEPPAAEPPASVAIAVVEPVVESKSSPKQSTRSLKTSESPAAAGGDAGRGTPKHAWAESKWVRFRTFVTQLSRHKKLSPFAEHLSAVSSMNIFLAALSCNSDFAPAIAAANKGDRAARDAAVEKGLQKTALANGIVTSDFPAGDYVKLQRFMALWVSMDSY